MAVGTSCSVGDCIGELGDSGAESECDDMHSALTHLAAYGATDCGGVSQGYDPSTVDACVVNSFESGKPFYAQYVWSDDRGWGANGWAGDGVHVFQVEWMAEPSHDVLSYTECLAPSVPSKASGDSGDDADQAGMFVLDCADWGAEQTLCDSAD